MWCPSYLRIEHVYGLIGVATYCYVLEVLCDIFVTSPEVGRGFRNEWCITEPVQLAIRSQMSVTCKQNMSRSMSKTRLESQCMKSYISKARTTGVYCSTCLLSMLYHTASSLRSHLVSWTLLEFSHHVEIDTWIWNRRGSEEGTSLLKTYSPKAKGGPSNHHLSSTLLAIIEPVVISCQLIFSPCWSPNVAVWSMISAGNKIYQNILRNLNMSHRPKWWF